MRFMKTGFILLAIIILAALSGCLESKANANDNLTVINYYSEKDPQKYIALYSNGAYYLSDGAQSGNYVDQKGIVYLLMPFGMSMQYQRDGQDLIRKEERWIRT